MRRRTFIATLGCAAARWPLTAQAQERVPRIGFLGTNETYLEALKAELRERGYVPGETIEIEFRFNAGREDQMAEQARELLDRKVELIVTNGVGAVSARMVTKTVPIVVATGGDLVMISLAENLAHPGGNVTGQTFFVSELIAKRIEMIKQIRPAMTSVGLLLPQGVSWTEYIPAIDVLVRALGVELKPIEVAEASDCDRALSVDPGASVGGLAVFDTPQFLIDRSAAVLADAAARRRLPSAGPLSYAKNGGLLGYGVDFFSLWSHSAVFVDKILKGAKPGDLPIQQATRFQTFINLKTAKTLGLEIPTTLLAASDEVIE